MHGERTQYMKMKLTTKEQMAITYFSEKSFKGARYIDVLYSDLFYKMHIEWYKQKKVGTSILDLSELTMIKFHCDLIDNSFGGRYTMLNNDTDSLVFNIQYEAYTSRSNKKSQYDLSDSVREDLKDDEHK